MKCDIGHFEIKAGGECYNLTPSFSNMMKIGEGSQLIDAYNLLHGLVEYSKNQDLALDLYMYTVGLAADVIKKCCDKDISSILIRAVDKNDKLKLKRNTKESLRPETQIIIAAGLVRHGIAGVSKEKKKKKGKAADNIDLWEFVNAARVHLDITREEALSLTMTEFNNLMLVKFPPEKNAAEDITDEEYDKAMANLERINKIRDAK